MKLVRWFKAMLVGAALIGLPAHASLFVDPGTIVSPVVVTFDEYFGLVTEGPENVGASVGHHIVMNATVPSTLGAFIADLGSNGTWAAFVDTGTPFAAIGELGGPGFGAMTFNYESGPVSAVGAFLNYFAPHPGVGLAVISALGAGNVLLESYVLSISTPADSYNAGGFFGIARASADIVGFSVFGNGFVLDNLTSTTPVPEPSTWLLGVAGLGLLGFMLRRRGTV